MLTCGQIYTPKWNDILARRTRIHPKTLSVIDDHKDRTLKGDWSKTRIRTVAVWSLDVVRRVVSGRESHIEILSDEHIVSWSSPRTRTFIPCVYFLEDVSVLLCTELHDVPCLRNHVTMYSPRSPKVSKGYRRVVYQGVVQMWLVTSCNEKTLH